MTRTPKTPSLPALTPPGLAGEGAAEASGTRSLRGSAGAAATSPAGGRRAADSVPPAGSRTWTLEFPPGMRLLSLNGRAHWSERHRRNTAIKDAAIILARQARIPRLARVSIAAEYQPPDRRHRDPDNIMPAAKSAVDGIVQAGCLPGDDSRFVASVACTIGPMYPKGRLLLHITEEAA